MYLQRGLLQNVNVVLVSMQKIPDKKSENAKKGLLIHPHHPSRSEESTDMAAMNVSRLSRLSNAGMSVTRLLQVALFSTDSFVCVLILLSQSVFIPVDFDPSPPLTVFRSVISSYHITVTTPLLSLPSCCLHLYTLSPLCFPLSHTHFVELKKPTKII